MDAIQCVLRVKPRFSQNFDKPVWSVTKNSIHRGDAETYTFSKIHELDNNEELFDKACSDIVESALDGFNGAVFAYGQSGSGKTHTLTGSDNEEGVLQLTLQRLFDSFSKSDRTFVLTISICEIYNEKVRDLIGSGVDLSVRETAKGEVIVEGLVKKPLTNLATAELTVADALERRSIGETSLNERSSRSHVIYMIDLESRSPMGVSSLTSSLHIVDLAGSENANVSHSSNRIAEGKNINKSLFTLCKVITNLAEKRPHVPYRESKLTRLLKNSLSGNSRVLLIATVDVFAASETSSSLKFAKCAVKVEVAPHVNEAAEEEGVLAGYLKQIEQLQQQLKSKDEDDKKNEEEKKRRLEEITKLIMVGGEQSKGARSGKKNRRMTWAPGKAAAAFSFSPYMKKRKVEESEVMPMDELDDNTPEEEQRSSLTSNGLSEFSGEGEEKEGQVCVETQTLCVESGEKSVQTDELWMDRTEEKVKELECANGSTQTVTWENCDCAAQIEQLLGEREATAQKHEAEMKKIRRECVEEIYARMKEKIEEDENEREQLRADNKRLQMLLRSNEDHEQSMYVRAEKESVAKVEQQWLNRVKEMETLRQALTDREEHLKGVQKEKEELQERMRAANELTDTLLREKKELSLTLRRTEERLEEQKRAGLLLQKEVELVKGEMDVQRKKEEELLGKLTNEEKERRRLMDTLRRAEEEAEKMRGRVERMEGEEREEKRRRVLIEKGRERKEEHTQTDHTDTRDEQQEAVDSPHLELERVKKEFTEYRTAMEEKERTETERARKVKSFWEDRARKAETELRDMKKKRPTVRFAVDEAS